MTANPTLGMRLGPLDKAKLKELATRLKRSQTQTIRDLVSEALAILQEQDKQKEQEAQATKRTDTSRKRTARATRTNRLPAPG